MKESCPFHSGRLAKYSPVVMQSMIRMYCDGDPRLCARYIVMSTLSRDQVPEDLTPNDMVRAKAIIKEYYEKRFPNKEPIKS